VQVEATATCWRDGNQVVVLRDSELPALCVRCAGPGVYRLEQDVSRSSRYFLVLFTFVVTRSSRVAFWLCRFHAERREKDLRLAWIGVALVAFLFVTLLFGYVGLANAIPGGSAVVSIVGVGGLAAGLMLGLYGWYATRLPQATHIGPSGDIWLAGVAQSLRETLPAIPRAEGPARRNSSTQTSRLGGSTSRARAPIADPPREPESRVVAPGLAFRGAKSAGSSQIRIFIVDDKEDTYANLAKLVGFEPDMKVVGIARDGAEAVHLAPAARPDVVVMDMNMPVMDGITATEMLTAMPDWNAAVVMMSIRDDEGYRRAALAAGARGYLVKPFSADEFIGCIRQVHNLEEPALPRARGPAQENTASETSRVAGSISREQGLAADPPREPESWVVAPGLAFRGAKSAGSSQIRILIVDDIQETCDNLAKLISFEPDLKLVGIARDGAEAVRIAPAARPDVVLMDILMPVMDGIAATRVLTNIAGWRAPVVMMSVQDRQDYHRDARLAGARGYLVKPFSAEELLGCIRQVHNLENPTRVLH
jgi:DNA-binding NarL/FixJ family response regulator